MCLPVVASKLPRAQLVRAFPEFLRDLLAERLRQFQGITSAGDNVTECLIRQVLAVRFPHCAQEDDGGSVEHGNIPAATRAGPPNLLVESKKLCYVFGTLRVACRSPRLEVAHGYVDGSLAA